MKTNNNICLTVPANPIDEITTTIIRAFNFYNGRINVVNRPANLIINTDCTGQDNIGGYTFKPNTVVMNPIAYCNNASHHHADVINKYNAITGVIHELFHIDQDYWRYDKIYSDTVDALFAKERSVYTQTAIYCANHIQELIALGVHPNLKYRIMNDCYHDAGCPSEPMQYVPYYRCTYKSHLVYLLSQLLGFYEDAEAVYDNCFNNPNGCLKITVNGAPTYIKQYNYVADISIVNAVFRFMELGSYYSATQIKETTPEGCHSDNIIVQTIEYRANMFHGGYAQF